VLTVFEYVVIAGIAFYLFYRLFALRFAASKIQKRVANKTNILHEVRHSLFTSFVFAIMAVAILYTPISNHTLLYYELDEYPLWWLPVSFVLSLVIHDTYFYWMHRLLHHKKLFKYAHLVHHKSTNPSPWASYSFHFLEAITEGGVLFVLAFTLPMHPIAALAFVIVGLVINVYGHLGYEIMPRGLRHSFLFEIINTSVHHNLHHSKFKGNYGLYFRIWDRICKTEHPDYVKEYDRVQQQRFSDKHEKKSANMVKQVPA
jgi:sterol desaturase/sphingolipid hydroxylase (fatty acid hydroxylase superfamily)